MANNTAPIHPKAGRIGWGTVATANTAMDGTGTVVTVFTAAGSGSVDSWVSYLKVLHLGTNVATVLRVFLNNGLTNATATNNSLIAEKTIAANTVSQTAESLQTNTIPIDAIIPTGYKLNVTVGTTIAAGLQVTPFGGDY